MPIFAAYIIMGLIALQVLIGCKQCSGAAEWWYNQRWRSLRRMNEP